MKPGDLVIDSRTGECAVIVEYIASNKYRESLLRITPNHSGKIWVSAIFFKIVK